MCGITGFIVNNSSKNLKVETTVSDMISKIIHRGPDDFGIWIDKDSRVALGHCRLSILDVSSAGHQPMHSFNNRYVISFNGEIYNHIEIRKKLQVEINKDFNWVGHSDTETLLTAFECWGVKKTLKECFGMFAFALWDNNKKILTLVRDRMGEKPLYYGWINNDFVFGSELKAIRAYPNFNNQISRKALAKYLQYNYVPAPFSIYKDIYKLEPGNYIEISSSIDDKTTIVPKKYWSLSEQIKIGRENLFTNENETLSLLQAKLKKAVKSQMLSDVPIGAFLSGGIDSSMIVALMQEQSSNPVKTFTIGFHENKFDESPHARSVAKHLGTDHNELFISYNNAKELLPKLPEIYDEPFADASQIPTFFLSQLAHQKIKVALSGDGGDELFGGYDRYFLYNEIWKQISWMPYSFRKFFGRNIKKFPKKFWDNINCLSKKIVSNKNGINLLGDRVYRMGQRLENIKSYEEFCLSLQTGWEFPELIIQDFKENSQQSSIFHSPQFDLEFKDKEDLLMYIDSIVFLPDDILCKIDRAAMANSLETRVPFLDPQVVELSSKMPLNMKIRNQEGKWALRQVLYRYLPQEFFQRPKAGLAIPLADWLRDHLKDWATDLLHPERIKIEGFFNPDYVSKIWNQHLSGQYNWSIKLWSILMFQSWLENQ